jgi:hypothetical protein
VHDSRESYRFGEVKPKMPFTWVQNSASAIRFDSLSMTYAKNVRQLPVNHSRCWPGGVPGQPIYPFEPLFFIQTPNEVWLIGSAITWSGASF